MNLWASSGTGYAALTSREYNGLKPQLILTIGIAGDINGDGDVDVVDLLYLVEAFGSVAGEAGYNVAADFNGDLRST